MHGQVPPRIVRGPRKHGREITARETLGSDLVRTSRGASRPGKAIIWEPGTEQSRAVKVTPSQAGQSVGWHHPHRETGDHALSCGAVWAEEKAQDLFGYAQTEG